jgi:hypothetical protein
MDLMHSRFAIVGVEQNALTFNLIDAPSALWQGALRGLHNPRPDFRTVPREKYLK